MLHIGVIGVTSAASAMNVIPIVHTGRMVSKDRAGIRGIIVVQLIASGKLYMMKKSCFRCFYLKQDFLQ